MVSLELPKNSPQQRNQTLSAKQRRLVVEFLASGCNRAALARLRGVHRTTTKRSLDDVFDRVQRWAQGDRDRVLAWLARVR